MLLDGSTHCKLYLLKSGSHTSQLQLFNVLDDVAGEACVKGDVSSDFH